MLRRSEGIVRRALSEPSIGSITTRAGSPPSPKADLAALLGDGDEGGALRGERLELGEDDVLAAAVDHQGAVAALADPLVDGALADRADASKTPRWAATIRRQTSSQSADEALRRLR